MDFGFFSVVQKVDDIQQGTLTIRVRVRSDLETLKQRYLPSLGEISASSSTDYRYRAKASREAFAVALSRIALDLNYSNFKDAVAVRQGKDRSHVYTSVWSALTKLSSLDKPSTAKASTATSYGGVLIDDDGRVLLRKPKGGIDGYAWTFAKEKLNGGTPQHAALSAVHQRTGYLAEIVARIPGTFQGGHSVAEYFLMRPVGKPLPFHPDRTEQIVWVDPAEAAARIGQTTNAAGRARDLAVLHAALGAKAFTAGSQP
jgi:hypothetical protein